MKHLYGFAFIFLLAFAAAESFAASMARTPVENLNQGILQLKQNKNSLFHAIKDNFDLERIAVFSIGKQRWKKWNKVQRKQYVNVFTQYMIAVYQNRFNGNGGGGLDIYKVREQKSYALVYTRITIKANEGSLSGKKQTKIDFSVYKKKKKWVISDVYFKGTISEVAGFRTQFASILREKGREGLVFELTKKCKALGNFCRL